MIPWVKCRCENYWCNIHKKHAHECECPPIDDWTTDPYTDHIMKKPPKKKPENILENYSKGVVAVKNAYQQSKNAVPYPKKRTRKRQVKRPIPAAKLLRAEATRLDVLKHGMPDAAEDMLSAQVWAFNLAAAFLDALGAPEKLVRYVPVLNTP